MRRLPSPHPLAFFPAALALLAGLYAAGTMDAPHPFPLPPPHVLGSVEQFRPEADDARKGRAPTRSDAAVGEAAAPPVPAPLLLIDANGERREEDRAVTTTATAKAARGVGPRTAANVASYDSSVREASPAIAATSVTPPWFGTRYRFESGTLAAEAVEAPPPPPDPNAPPWIVTCGPPMQGARGWRRVYNSVERRPGPWRVVVWGEPPWRPFLGCPNEAAPCFDIVAATWPGWEAALVPGQSVEHLRITEGSGRIWYAEIGPGADPAVDLCSWR